MRVASGDDIDLLIEKAQDGDVRAFETLLAEHLPRVRRFARGFAASDSDADDLAQEALLKVYKSLRLFRYQSACHGNASWSIMLSTTIIFPANLPLCRDPAPPAVIEGPTCTLRCGKTGLPSGPRNWSNT